MIDRIDFTRLPTPAARPRPPLPLARLTATFNSPADPGELVTLEVIVLDDVEGQADVHDLNELLHAGWFFQDLGSLTMAYRIHLG